ncbi:hypothetical protein CYMTET_50205 [Cymbomonas tetramitiformis]|uniref:Uncharacterized protein n=1 Tax=Cymbomonas tetramitiformis TaxID=36881 RepID=A0AAE0BQ72_9CHLO|nr:hypothetical protein CYMTET_50205 [Cymbomonas tetramitiformis]
MAMEGNCTVRSKLEKKNQMTGKENIDTNSEKNLQVHHISSELYSRLCEGPKHNNPESAPVLRKKRLHLKSNMKPGTTSLPAESRSPTSIEPGENVTSDQAISSEHNFGHYDVRATMFISSSGRDGNESPSNTSPTSVGCELNHAIADAVSYMTADEQVSISAAQPLTCSTTPAKKSLASQEQRVAMLVGQEVIWESTDVSQAELVENLMRQNSRLAQHSTETMVLAQRYSDECKELKTQIGVLETTVQELTECLGSMEGTGLTPTKDELDTTNPLFDDSSPEEGSSSSQASPVLAHQSSLDEIMSEAGFSPSVSEAHGVTSSCTGWCVDVCADEPIFARANNSRPTGSGMGLHRMGVRALGLVLCISGAAAVVCTRVRKHGA